MKDEITVISQIIGNIGFPCFVAYYLLTKHGKLLQEIIEAIQEVKLLIQSVNGKAREEAMIEIRRGFNAQRRTKEGKRKKAA